MTITDGGPSHRPGLSAALRGQGSGPRGAGRQGPLHTGVVLAMWRGFTLRSPGGPPTLELGKVSLKKVGSQDSRMKKEQAAESWEKTAALQA